MPETLFSKKTFFILLAIFIASRLISMVFVPLMDPSEARYAILAKSMVESGNFWEPRYYYEGVNQVFLAKPPLAFQMSAACCKAFGMSVFATRLPAFLSALAILGIIYLNVKRLRNEQCAMCATLLCASSFMFFLYAGLTMTDLILTAAIVGAIFSYIRFESAQESKDKKIFSILFFVTLAVGTLIKGPVALVMAGLPVFFHVLINNRWKELRFHSWIIGSALFLAIVIPYYWYMGVQHPEFIRYFILEENFNRFLFKGSASQFGTARESFRGSAFCFFILLNIPLVFLIQLYPKTNFTKMYNWALFRDPLCGIAALTFITITLFWCLTSRVLITYLLPTIPFSAVFLAVRFNDGGLMESARFNKLLRIFIAVFICFLPIAITSGAMGGIAFSNELPAPFLLQAKQIIENDNRNSESKIYFCYDSPHSAEYYIPQLTKFHIPDKNAQESVKNSVGYFFAIKDKDLKSLGAPLNRKLLLKYGKWNLFAAPDTDYSKP